MWGEKQYSFEFVFSLDLWAATVFFGVLGISVSTLAGLVRDGKDAPFKLWGWQRSFLRWLEPKLSREHCEGAITYDRERAQRIIQMLGP